MDSMKSLLEYSLSGEDIGNLLNKQCNIVPYNEIKNFNNIFDLMGPYRKCAILYLTSANYGHWTCIYEHNNTIYFFDSYGCIPDGQFKFIPNKLNKELGQDFSYLVNLMYNSKLPVEYNEYKLQKFKKGINTCGRWCAVRMQYPEVSINDFNKIFKNKSLSPDELVCLLTF